MTDSNLVTIHSQPSWRIQSKYVEAFLTETGGHLGPVRFSCAGTTLEPYSVAPWVNDTIAPAMPPLIKVLRGDFFCLPFGGNGTPYNGEEHPPHGEVCNEKWKFEGIEQSTHQQTLHVSMDTQVRAGHVDKYITLNDGHRAVYTKHVISGMSGPMPLGHHAMLKFPDIPGCARISTSTIKHGRVFVEPAEDPADRGYSILKPGATFESLESVPTITGETTDLSSYPNRRGFEDIAMIIADDELPFAWTAAVVEEDGYVWFSLKDPRVLRGTVFWISNGGRHYEPWNGRHVNVLGLEEVTGFFHTGVAESAEPNALSDDGFPTYLDLNPDKPLHVNYITAVAAIPDGFGRVSDIKPSIDRHSAIIESDTGHRIEVPLDTSFLTS